MTHPIAKRFKLAKHGSTFLLTLALSVGANAMDNQAPGKAKQAPTKSDCNPVTRTHTDAVPTYDHDTLRTGLKVDRERTITDVVTKVKTERWVTADYESMSDEEVIPEGPVNNWSEIKPIKECKTIPTQVISSPKVDVKCALPEVKPVQEKTIVQADKSCGKSEQTILPVEKPCLKTEPMPVCDKPAQIQKSVQSGPCLDTTPVCHDSVVCLSDIRSFATGPFVQITDEDWFDNNEKGCQRQLARVKFGHKWSHGSHKTQDWDKSEYSNFLLRYSQLRSINAHHANWSNWDIIGGRWHDVEVEKGHLTNMLFQGSPSELFKMKSCKFDNSHLTNVIFRNVKFDHSKKKAWRPTSFKNTFLENVLFENVDFDHVTFDGAIFKDGTQFAKCNSGACFTKFVGAQVWMGEHQKYNVITQQSVTKMQSACQGKPFGYEQLRQYSQAQQY